VRGTFAALLILSFLGLAGCATPAEAPRVAELLVTYRNQPDREFGDLLDESVTIESWLEDGDGRHDQAFSVGLAPGELHEVSYAVADLDEFTLAHHGTSRSGTGSGGSTTFTQSQCGHLGTIHMEVVYSAKLTAGAWSWGNDWTDDCSGPS
jgi:hypothetical protein